MLSDVLAFALFVVLARAFGPEGIGVYAFNFAIATILYEIVALGVEEYGVREFSRDPASGPALLGRLLKVQIAIALLGCAALVSMLPVMHNAHPALLAFLVLYQLAFAAARTLFIPAFVDGRLAPQIVGEVVARAAALLFAIVVIQQSVTPSLAGTLAGLPLFAFALLAVAAVSARSHGGVTLSRIPLRHEFNALRPVWSFAAANLLSSVYGRTGVLVLFVILGESEAGLFSSAFKFVEVGWTVLALIPWAGYPLLTRAFAERSEHFLALAKQVLRGTLLGGVLLAWGLFWIVPWLMSPLLGADFESAIPILKALAGLMVLVAISEVLERLLLVADLQDARLKVLAVQTALNLVLGIVLIRGMGALGMVLAFALTQGVTIVAFYWLLRSKTPMDWTARDAALIGLGIVIAVVAGSALLNFDFRPELAAGVSLLSLVLLPLAMRWVRFDRNA